jgi:L-threonylcarbamoyladenylate synthase
MGERLKVDQRHPSEDVLARVSELLAADGVVVTPTDSVYGIACAALPKSTAHQRIFAIKRRPAGQTLPWLVADAADLARYGRSVPDEARRLAEAFWPGALTLVVAASDAVPAEYVLAGEGGEPATIALRCPDSPLVRELARRVGPLPTTSANLHGGEAATSGSDIDPAVAELADLVLDAGPAPVGVASTIVDCTHAELRMLREGAISPAQIAAALA